MDFFIDAMGVKVLRTKFTRAGAAALDIRPALEVIAQDMMATEEQVFLSQGRRGGGSWKRLTVEWMVKKSLRRLDPRINIASFALIESVTERGAEGQILRFTNNGLTFGSSLPQAGPSQRNRPFIKFTPTDRLRFRNHIQGHLRAAWNAR